MLSLRTTHARSGAPLHHHTPALLSCWLLALFAVVIQAIAPASVSAAPLFIAEVRSAALSAILKNFAKSLSDDDI